MKPLRWVPTGRVLALGVVIDPALVGERRARERALGWVGRGGTVSRSERGWIVRWPAPRPIRPPYPGAPLLAGPPVSSAPLTPTERASAPPLSVVEDGALVALVPGPELDPVDWLALELPIHVGRPLDRGVAAPPEVVLDDRPLGPDGLGVVVDPERDDVVDRLGDWRPSALERWIEGVGAWFGGAVERWAAGVAGSLGLERVLGARLAGYFDDLVARLEAGDWAEALRRAIPLGGEVPGGRPWWGSLPLRGSDALDLRRRTGGRPGRAVSAGTLYERLQALYRRAAERLEAEGRHPQAAFVYDELLRSPDEAIAVLERGRLFSTAARLADVRDQPAGLRVRLWWLAGDRPRAVRLARRHLAFADAVVRLSGHPACVELRIAWARSLAEAGQWGQAVDVAQDLVPEERRRWAVRAIAEGGAPGGRLLPQVLAEDPSAWPVWAAVVERWGRMPEPVALRALLDAFGDARTAPALARLATRVALCAPSLPADVIERAARQQGLAVLAADVPAEGPTNTLDATEPGTTPISDVARAIDGSWWVALGDAGVVQVDATGQVIGHVEWPAVRIVPCGDRNRMLLIGARGGVAHVAKLDASTRALTPWADARLSAYAAIADDGVWFVADGDTVYAIDLASDRWEALWRVRVGAPAEAIAVDERRVWLSAGPPIGETWGWDRALLVLRHRTPHLEGPPERWITVVGGVRRGWPFAQPGATAEHFLRPAAGGLEWCAPGRAVVALPGARAGGVGSWGSARWAFDDRGRIVFVIGDRPGVVRL